MFILNFNCNLSTHAFANATLLPTLVIRHGLIDRLRNLKNYMLEIHSFRLSNFEQLTSVSSLRRYRPCEDTQVSCSEISETPTVDIRNMKKYSIYSTKCYKKIATKNNQLITPAYNLNHPE